MMIKLKIGALIGLILAAIGIAARADGINVPFSFPATVCTNQFIRSIAAATGVGTCASVAIGSDVSGLGTGVATLLGGSSSGTGGPAGTTSPSFTTSALIGTAVNAISDQTGTGSARPFIVQQSDTNTTVGGSLASLNIVNSATTTNNSAQLGFGAITGASTNQYISAMIAGVFGARTNTQYPTGDLVLSTSNGGTGIGPTEKMRVSSTGAVTMPFLAASSAAQTGTVCWTTGGGNLTVDTTTTCLLSSARFKHDIHPLSGSLDTVLALKPVSYEYNEMIKGQQVGLIAEDVADVDDRLVSHDPSDGSVRAVRYQQLTAHLIGAIQQQQKEIEELKRRIGHAPQ